MPTVVSIESIGVDAVADGIAAGGFVAAVADDVDVGDDDVGQDAWLPVYDVIDFERWHSWSAAYANFGPVSCLCCAAQLLPFGLTKKKLLSFKHTQKNDCWH